MPFLLFCSSKPTPRSVNWPWMYTLRFERKNSAVQQLDTAVLHNALAKYLAKYDALQHDGANFRFQLPSLWAVVSIELRVERDAQDHFRLLVSYKTADIVVVGILLMALLAMLGGFSHGLYWTLGLILGLGYSVAHNWIIWFELLNLFRKFPLYVALDENKLLAQQQSNWADNAQHCSACGQHISVYDQHCRACGLLVQQKPKVYPVTTSKYATKGIRYTFKHNTTDDA